MFYLNSTKSITHLLRTIYQNGMSSVPLLSWYIYVIDIRFSFVALDNLFHLNRKFECHNVFWLWINPQDYVWFYIHSYSIIDAVRACFCHFLFCLMALFVFIGFIICVVYIYDVLIIIHYKRTKIAMDLIKASIKVLFCQLCPISLSKLIFGRHLSTFFINMYYTCKESCVCSFCM